MTVTLKSLGIDQLGIEDRLALVEEIWDSIVAENATMPVPHAQREELDQRIAEHEAHPEQVVPWEEVRSAASEHLKK